MAYFNTNRNFSLVLMNSVFKNTSMHFLNVYKQKGSQLMESNLYQTPEEFVKSMHLNNVKKKITLA